MRPFIFLLLFPLLVWARPGESFANSLFAQARYEAALLEYERMLFYHADSVRSGYWQYRAGQCRVRSGRLEDGIKGLALITASPYADSARLLSAECLLRLNRPAAADSQLTGLKNDRAAFLSAYSSFLQGQYEAVSRQSDNGQIRALAALTDSLMAFKSKSYIPAGMLSLIPGAGHLYTRRYGDGLFSAFVVGLFGAGTAYYAYHDSKDRAIVFASFTGLFYLGSIYGALMGVKIYNRDIPAGYRRNAAALLKGP